MINTNDIEKNISNENFDFEILIKFVEKKRVDSFLNGEIHFPSFDYFIDLEKKTQDDKIGDKYETSQLYNFKTTDTLWISMLDDEGRPIKGEAPIKIHPNNGAKIKFGMGRNIEKNFGLASFFKISLSNGLELKQQVGKANDGWYGISEKFLTDLNKLYDEDRVPVIICNIKQLIDQFGKLKKTGYGPITYYDENEIDIRKEMDSNFFKQMLIKRKKYEYQHEFRLISSLEEVDERNNVQIGNIRKYSTAIAMDDIDKFRMYFEFKYSEDNEK